LKVGKYGVRIQDLDQIAVPAMIPSSPDEIVIIDEIGKMECLSTLFRETLIRTLDSDSPVIGSIALRGGPFIEEIKKRNDVTVIAISEKNRDTLADELSRIADV
jgi:nucleoside-triphosphatase